MAYSDDYREVATTAGLEALTAQEKIKSSVVMVIGSAHINPISDYAESPEKIKAKFPNLTKPKIQIFQLDQSGQWARSDIENVL